MKQKLIEQLNTKNQRLSEINFQLMKINLAIKTWWSSIKARASNSPIEKEQDPLIQMMLRSKLDQLKEQAQQFIKIGNNVKNEILRLEKLYENCPDDSTMN